MNDFSVLKKLAQDANEQFPALEDQWSMVCTPSVGLELLAEIDRLAEEYDKAWRHDLNDKNNVQVLTAEVVRLNAEIDRLRTAEGDAMTYKAGMENVAQQRDQLKAENEALRRRAEFWRSPDDMPESGAEVVVLRDAGIVGNGLHPGSRAGRWLELTTTFVGRMFACDAISTGRVIGWVPVEEFLGFENLRKDAERLRWLRDSSQYDWDVSYGKLEIRIETPHDDSSDLDACIDAAMSKADQ